jgi:hypothetical protein
MERKYASEAETTEVLKESVWLAWQASGVHGLGVLQDNPTAQREKVWEQAYNERDYSGRKSTGGDVNADYVFGRMMKLYVRRPDATTIEIPDGEPRGDYQSWCYQYPSFSALFDAAEKAIQKQAE